MSLWNGPETDGVTNSLLCRWLVCRERFRLYAVEGLAEDEGFREAMEFGNLWHAAEEAQCGGLPWMPAAQEYYQQLRRTYGDAHDAQVRKQWNCLRTAFPIYLDWWSSHKDERMREPLLSEAAFRVPFELPSGRVVLLRGKFDAVPLYGSTVVLQENKCKSRIDVEGITKTLDRNLQTMIYQTALRQLARGVGELDECVNTVEGYKVGGVLYNVIRRPLGDFTAIKQRKGRLVWNKAKTAKIRKGAETERMFYKRLGQMIKAKPQEYFHRWKVTLKRVDIVRFHERVLIPILETLCDWWESMPDPHNPWWDAQGRPNRLHWQSPWGVYNSLGMGFRGDFFRYLTTGGESGLRKVSTLYPELEE